MSTQSLSPEIRAKLQKLGLSGPDDLQGVMVDFIHSLPELTMLEKIQLVKYLYPPSNQPAAAAPPADTFLDDMTDLAAMLATDEPFVFDINTYHKFMGYYIGKSADSAATDLRVLQWLLGGAGKGIVNQAFSRSAGIYMEQKPKAGQFPLPSGATLYIVPEDKRQSFWKEMDEMLWESGFYTLISQLSMRHRSKTPGAHMDAQSTYTAGQLGEKHKKFLNAVTYLLSDTDKLALAERVLAEQKFVLTLIQDSNFLANVVTNASGGNALNQLWAKPEMKMHKTILQMSRFVSEALLSLAKYDPNLSYDLQMEQYEPHSDALYTAMEELAIQASSQYSMAFNKKEGIDAIVKVLQSTLSRRSNFNSNLAQSGESTQAQFVIQGELDRLLSRELRGILATLYPNKEDSERLIADVGLYKGAIELSGKAVDNASGILTEAAKHNQIGAVLDLVLQEFPQNTALQAFVQKLPKT